MNRTPERVTSARFSIANNSSAVLWSILVIAIACLGLAIYSHISVRASFAQAQAEFNQRFEAMTSRFGPVADEKLPGIAKNVSDLQTTLPTLATQAALDERAKPLEENLAALQSQLNSGDVKLASLTASLERTDENTASLQQSHNQLRDKLAVLDSLVPIGTILPFFGNPSQLPSQWLPCDGRSTGSSSWTSVPDLRGKFLRGTEGAYVLGSTGGKDSIPDHFHTVSGSSRDVWFAEDSIVVSLPHYTQVTSAEGLTFDPNIYAVPLRPNGSGSFVSHGHQGGTASFNGRTNSAGGYDNRPVFISVNYICRVR